MRTGYPGDRTSVDGSHIRGYLPVLCHNRGEQAAEKTKGRLDANDRLTEMGYVSAAQQKWTRSPGLPRVAKQECLSAGTGFSRPLLLPSVPCDGVSPMASATILLLPISEFPPIHTCCSTRFPSGMVYFGGSEHSCLQRQDEDGVLTTRTQPSQESEKVQSFGCECNKAGQCGTDRRRWIWSR